MASDLIYDAGNSRLCVPEICIDNGVARTINTNVGQTSDLTYTMPTSLTAGSFLTTNRADTLSRQPIITAQSAPVTDNSIVLWNGTSGLGVSDSGVLCAPGLCVDNGVATSTFVNVGQTAPNLTYTPPTGAPGSTGLVLTNTTRGTTPTLDWQQVIRSSNAAPTNDSVVIWDGDQYTVKDSAINLTAGGGLCMPELCIENTRGSQTVFNNAGQTANVTFTLPTTAPPKTGTQVLSSSATIFDPHESSLQQSCKSILCE